jgi:hypothetical protein
MYEIKINVVPLQAELKTKREDEKVFMCSLCYLWLIERCGTDSDERRYPVSAVYAKGHVDGLQ